MLRRLACLLWLPASVALLPEAPFECDNARCRVRPRATIYAAERVCAPGNYTCASCCDPDPNCRCGAGAAGHATAPTANATAVRLHLRAAFPDRAAQLAALSDARAVEAFKGLAWRTPRCPAGYYECAGCCDRDADCACDGACDLGADADCALAYGAGGAKPDGWCPVWKSKFYVAFVLDRRVVLHAIDATPARWRDDAGSSPLDRARTAASSPRNDLVKNCRYTRRTG